MLNSITNILFQETSAAWFSRMTLVWLDPISTPAVICHCCLILPPLISFSPLISWLNLLPCSWITSPQFTGKLPKWLWKKCIFILALRPRSPQLKLSLCYLVNSLFEVVYVFIYKESLNHCYERFPSSWLNIIHWFNKMRILASLTCKRVKIILALEIRVLAITFSSLVFNSVPRGDSA